MTKRELEALRNTLEIRYRDYKVTSETGEDWQIAAALIEIWSLEQVIKRAEDHEQYETMARIFGLHRSETEAKISRREIEHLVSSLPHTFNCQSVIINDGGEGDTHHIRDAALVDALCRAAGIGEDGQDTLSRKARVGGCW